MLKLIKWLVIALIIAVIGLFTFAYLIPRPDVMTAPETLAGDGSQANYCELPVLDGSGKRARDIPKGNTPGCSYEHFPLPILAECTEPLPEGADDLRGLWRGISGRVGHVERIEQCGSRTVVTAGGIIHDYGPNSTGVLNTDDTEGGVLFTIGDREFCPRTSASMIWEDGILNFYVFGWGPKVVTRARDGEHVVWEYADGTVTRMERLCQLPEEHKKPKPRGARLFKLF